MAGGYHAIHKEVYAWFNIIFDHFGGTSTPQQTEICQSIFSKLLDNNWLSENTMQQLYYESCQRFLADKFVVGSCPVEGCGNDTARGDQCDKCGRLLNSTELIDPRCMAGGTCTEAGDEVPGKCRQVNGIIGILLKEHSLAWLLCQGRATFRR
ncbi:methionyl-tRNA synthetase [Hordeum vulgare]|nr:methionyl-tRNA synthetase [Hordeum vulgare]